MAKLRNVFVIISERGVLVLLKAIFNLCHASFIKYILREKHICKKIFNYKMYLDLFDPGISRSLILFSEREIDHKIILENKNITNFPINLALYLTTFRCLPSSKSDS